MKPAEEQNIEGSDKLETRKAKTHKGRRYLDLFKPKLNEDPRKCLILKGNKTSEWVTKTMDYFVGKTPLTLSVCDQEASEHEIPKEERNPSLRRRLEPRIPYPQEPLPHVHLRVDFS